MYLIADKTQKRGLINLKPINRKSNKKELKIEKRGS